MSKTEDNIIALPSVEDIEAEAASWLTVLGREDVASTDMARFRLWLKKSERHREAFRTLSALWDDMTVLKELDDIAEAMVEMPQQEKQSLLTRRRAAFAALAASLIIAITGGTIFQLTQSRNLVEKAVFITAVGEQKTIQLSDSSTVQMNTDSRMEIDFSASERRVRLLQGEAYFKVAKNSERPFLVYAAKGVVRAVGTAFTVRLRPNDAVEVTVEEGRVALVSLSNPVIEERLSMAELTAGQSAVFNEKVEHLAQMAQSEVSRKLAWRQGMLAYAGDPLADVIADISRYTDITIEIADPSLGTMPIGGHFRVGEIKALFDALELTFGIEVDYLSKNHVRLSSSS